MHLIFWDLGGQAGLRSIWDKYYAESNALIYLIDASAGLGCLRMRFFCIFPLLVAHVPRMLAVNPAFSLWYRLSRWIPP